MVQDMMTLGTRIGMRVIMDENRDSDAHGQRSTLFPLEASTFYAAGRVGGLWQELMCV